MSTCSEDGIALGDSGGMSSIRSEKMFVIFSESKSRHLQPTTAYRFRQSKCIIGLIPKSHNYFGHRWSFMQKSNIYVEPGPLCFSRNLFVSSVSFVRFIFRKSEMPTLSRFECEGESISCFFPTQRRRKGAPERTDDAPKHLNECQKCKIFLSKTDFINRITKLIESMAFRVNK